MNREDFERIPDAIYSGKMTVSEAVREMAAFIANNKPVFKLQNYDEDFLSDFFIAFLERGEKSFATYDSSQGSFFSYTFCFVKNLCISVRKKRTLAKVMDYHSTSEYICVYEEKIQAYENIKYEDFAKPKVPFVYNTPVSYKDFQIACKTNAYQIKKILKDENNIINPVIKEKLLDYSPRMIQNVIIVLALKSAFYITEEQICKISKWFNIEKAKLDGIIREIKDNMNERIAHKEEMIEKRNKAYLQHKKIRGQILWNESNNENSEYLNNTLNKRYEKNTSNWTILNHQLEEGKIHIRPTTKMIAQVLGISSRQVTYYQTTAKKIGLDLNKV